MKKCFVIFLMAIITYFISPQVMASTDEELISSQAESLGISSFLSDSEKYTKDVFGDIDVNEIFKASVSGNFDNNMLMNIIFTLLGDNIKDALSTIATVMIIIVIHSILKAISENLGNENVSKIAYFIEYILIITLIMTNFSTIITEMKTAVQNLTGFANSLIPLMITLMITTGNIVSSGMLQPILLLLVTFIS